MLEIKEHKEGDFVVLELVGRLETKTSHEFEKKVIEVLSSGSRQLLVDLKQTEYVSSAGLRVLLMLSKKLNGTGGHLALCSLSEGVRQVFEIAGFSSFFLIAASPKEAMKKAATAPKLPTTPSEKPAPGRAAATAPDPDPESPFLEQIARALGVDPASRPGPASESPEPGAASRAAELLGVKPGSARKKPKP